MTVHVPTTTGQAHQLALTLPPTCLLCEGIADPERGAVLYWTKDTQDFYLMCESCHDVEGWGASE